MLSIPWATCVALPARACVPTPVSSLRLAFSTLSMPGGAHAR